MSIFKSRSAASSRRSSIADSKPTNSEIFTDPEPGCGPKKTQTYTPDQQAMVRRLMGHIRDIADDYCATARVYAKQIDELHKV
jgi:hypothetical protein